MSNEIGRTAIGADESKDGAAKAPERTDEPQLPAVDKLPVRRELPPVLEMLDGRKIASVADWEKLRRPELRRLFQHYMYGYFPKVPQPVSAKVTQEDEEYFGGAATKRLVTLSFGPPQMPTIDLLMVIPNHRKAAAPVFLGVNFCGNHAVLDDPTIPLSKHWVYPSCEGQKDNHATEASRGKQVDTWAIRNTIERGYAVALFYTGDIDPDRDDWTDGVHPHFFEAGQTKPARHDWGTIAAWAWGMQRAVDYLVTDKDIDPKKIAAVGHSRNGKTALLAAAFDDRIALAIPHQAGCGGTAPSRGKVGESVKAINDHFPHWFDDEFTAFNEQPERLPFDQHALIALVAPRPVLLSNAQEDQWANPAGQFEVLQAARPAYALYGADDLKDAKMPELNRLIDGKLGFYIRPGKHAMTSGDWKVFLDFADRHFGKPAK